MPNSKIILSYHDFETTPLDLESLFQSAFLGKEADMYKLATWANSTLDAIRMFQFTISKTSSCKFCGIAMGEMGSLTRILAPLSKSALNFCSQGFSQETALGQLTLQDFNTHIQI